MSKIFVDQVDPKTATTLTLGTSGDTVSIPSGVTISNAGTATGFGVSLANGVDNRVVTSSSATALNGEANLEFDGTDFKVLGKEFIGVVGSGGATTGKQTISFGSGEAMPQTLTAANSYIALGNNEYGDPSSANGKVMIAFGYTEGASLTNAPAYFGYDEELNSGKTKGALTFYTRSVTTDTAPTERMRIDSSGDVRIYPTGAKLSVGGAGATSGYVLGSVNNDIKIIGETGAGIRRGSNSTEIWYDGTQMYPNIDASKNLGHSSFRFDTLYATNGTINTSDRNEKENINDSELGIDFLNKLRPVQYTWKNKTTPERLYKEGDIIPEDKKIGDVWTEEETTNHKRRHYGLIAQEVETVLTDNNISTENFAPFIKTKKYIQDESNHKLIEQEDYIYGMRYNELIGILIKGIQELSDKVTTLENK